MSVYDDRREEFEKYEFMMGTPRGRLAVTLDILTDALVVRKTLVPPFLTLMGERAWYIPRWLDRLLPDITIEPPHDRSEPVSAPAADRALVRE